MKSQTSAGINAITNLQDVIDVNISIELRTSMEENLSEGWGN